MNSSTNSSSKAQCPAISEALVDWIDAVFPPITTSRGTDLRELDLQSGAREVVDYLREQSTKQRS